ncbi:uroporphyrinogen decarboxylase family protein [Coraliomargarita akajimensis]|uniref:Uroporphyrinogen decarboxylase (URO-D) n=1 Tax=Coraliomargarita akajimensis (strain DSM 45221 / IAM 15411 / JCM 23193 / KCTC 12865 / 04OKA010-24) TaxID=583355 RepID=D5EMH2_CORAD|nr:uroporphyrinogen decarboxylase family protein [Coraliomargarita akajimensis]ADE53378.1 Uroporphyrinogen decarboxylase (URO-D) [Coraliomargarita akajimensis DSM 45221]
MGNKANLFKALKGEATDQTPWVPFVGVHGGALIGVDATEYLQNADHIVNGMKAANDKYKPDGLPVVFDLQLEAEILGCQLAWAKETPPSVASHVLDDEYDIEGLPEFSVEKGRIPLVLDAIRRTKEAIGKDVALYGLLTGPLTLALHLRGDDVLLDMFDDEDEVPELFDYCADIANQMVKAYLDAGIDVIGVVDPMISQISPEHFSQYVAPPLNKIFDYTAEQGALSSLFVCGNATRNIEAMCQTNCDNISVDENVDMKVLAETCAQYGKSFGGNLQLTVVLLLGDSADAQKDALRCMDLSGGKPGFVLAPGCDLPYAVKPENLTVIADMVNDPYKIDVARSLPDKQSDDRFDDVVIPDYGNEAEVVVDVITLDSAGCAPCAYMLKAAQEAAKAYDKPVRVLEHKITGRDGLGYMTKLGATAIPSLCIDGQEQFASIIPEREALVGKMLAAADAKA